MAKGNQTKARNLAYREKQATALDMRRKGHLLREIAEALGIDSEATISKLIRKALKELVREPAEHVLQLELDRLDAMFVQAFTRAEDREQPFNRDAVETCLKVMERRAKLLGMDKPTKVANTDPAGEREGAPLVQFYLPSNHRE